MSAASWEDYDPGLLARNIAHRDRAGGLHHPGSCGPCEDCSQFQQEQTIYKALRVRGASSVTWKSLRQHARRFGSELVYETGQQSGLPALELRRLRVELDTMDAAKPARGRVAKPRKRSRAETRVMIQALSARGWTRREIAEELGVRDKTVDNYLAPGAVSATQGLGGAVLGMKPPANRGVRNGQIALLPASQAGGAA